MTIPMMIVGLAGTRGCESHKLFLKKKGRIGLMS